MSMPSAVRPGAGLVILSLSLLGSLAFFGWGLRTPPLDDVWRIQIEIGLGQGGGMSDRDFQLLQRTLRRYPDLAASLLEDADSDLISANSGGVVGCGFAYLLRRGSGSPGNLVISGIGGGRPGIHARTQGASMSGTADDTTPLRWRLPDTGPFPQLVEVRLSGGIDPRRVPAALVRLLP